MILIRLTDLLELEVVLLALLYRRRWQIELFFRWFKKVLQADRLLALSENGLTLVVYCALIASMLEADQADLRAALFLLLRLGQRRSLARSSAPPGAGRREKVSLPGPGEPAFYGLRRLAHARRPAALLFA